MLTRIRAHGYRALPRNERAIFPKRLGRTDRPGSVTFETTIACPRPRALRAGLRASGRLRNMEEDCGTCIRAGGNIQTTTAPRHRRLSRGPAGSQTSGAAETAEGHPGRGAPCGRGPQLRFAWVQAERPASRLLRRGGRSLQPASNECRSNPRPRRGSGRLRNVQGHDSVSARKAIAGGSCKESRQDPNG